MLLNLVLLWKFMTKSNVIRIKVANSDTQILACMCCYKGPISQHTQEQERKNWEILLVDK